MRFRADTIIGALLLALVLVLFSMSFYLPPAPYGTMGPALFPRVLLVVLIPLCLLLFLKSLFHDLRVRREALRPFAEWFEQYRNVLVAYFLFFFLALALSYAGYLISGFIFLFSMQAALGPKTAGKMIQHLIVTTLVLLLLYFLFQILLQVFLPEGEIF